MMKLEEALTMKLSPLDLIAAPDGLSQVDPGVEPEELKIADERTAVTVAASCSPPGWRSAFNEDRIARNLENGQRFCAMALRELNNHMVPLVLLGALLIFPRLLILWVPAVLLWWLIEAGCQRLKPNTRERLKRLLPAKWIDSRLFRELSEGLGQVRPFVLASIYLFCVPVALVWMYAHWLLRPNKSGESEKSHMQDDNKVVFKQNRRQSEEEEEANFFHSPAFALTCLVLFVSGLPALLTYFLYQALGVDAVMGFPSLDPQFSRIFLNIGLYLYSVAWCGSVLFFRSWFTFPLNFIGSEEEIELNERGIKRHNRSWYTQVLTFNTPWAGPPSLQWSEIKCLRLDRSNSTLYPLPATAFPANSLIYNLLNRLALFVDGLQKNGQREEYAYFTTADQPNDSPHRAGCHSSIRLNLCQLSGDERTRLYYAVRKWAPQVAVDEALQEKMMGTSVLQAPRYTQMWFELLADRMPIKRSGALSAGTVLDRGRLTVVERLASGGQANVYLARQADGCEVVLKEFILSTSDAVGALVESAGEFETESTLLSELVHPRIVKMHGCIAEDRRLYIVLEKVEGLSLRRLVRERQEPLSEKETVEVALQVCEVLEYLHTQQPPVVHRDIAPDNIMFSEAQGVRVVDFSLAAGKKVRRTTSTMGKHSYAPPEQFREQPCAQSDIYALGATMYFLLTGEDPRPITCSDVRAKRADVSESLQDIIKRATAFNLEDRYASVAWLRLDLEAAAGRIETRSARESDAEPES
jgi:hypothetical protein